PLHARSSPLSCREPDTSALESTRAWRIGPSCPSFPPIILAFYAPCLCVASLPFLSLVFLQCPTSHPSHICHLPVPSFRCLPVYCIVPLLFSRSLLSEAWWDKWVVLDNGTLKWLLDRKEGIIDQSFPLTKGALRLPLSLSLSLSLSFFLSFFLSSFL